MKTFLDHLARFLPDALRVLALRFDRSPFLSVDPLEEFVRTRSSYVAQTSLFGYLKARMGTRYRVMFEDDVFSHAIRTAAAKLFGSCLSDLSIYAASKCRIAGNLNDAQTAALAGRLFFGALEKGLEGFPDAQVSADAISRFRQRTTVLDWDRADDISLTFATSEADLVRFAPVVDEFKELDREIVMNSIRFRWRDIREQMKRRLRAEAVAEAWKARHRAGEPDENCHVS